MNNVTNGCGCGKPRPTTRPVIVKPTKPSK